MIGTTALSQAASSTSFAGSPNKCNLVSGADIQQRTTAYLMSSV
jgi:hypothetical protein